MIVIDTHVWIWWASDPEKLSRRAAQEIRRAKQIGVCAISCWEFTTALSKGRITVDREPLAWLLEALALPSVELLPLSPAVAARANQLGSFHGDPADRMIVATTLLESATLITKDTKIHDYPAIRCVW